MDWLEIAQFPDQVFRIREPALAPLHGSNLWLVRGERASLLIDTGVGVAPLRPVVEALSASPVICLLTHGHYDHIGGAHEFADRRAHRFEAAVLAHPDPCSTQWEGWLTRDSFSRAPAETFDAQPPEANTAAPETQESGTRKSDTHVTGAHPTQLPKSETNDAG